jgi:hypothetical protein
MGYKTLLSGISRFIVSHIRIWYSSNHYAVFKSNGIVVMGQAPALTSKRGKTVCISVVVL